MQGNISLRIDGHTNRSQQRENSVTPCTETCPRTRSAIRSRITFGLTRIKNTTSRVVPSFSFRFFTQQCATSVFVALRMQLGKRVRHFGSSLHTNAVSRNVVAGRFVLLRRFGAYRPTCEARRNIGSEDIDTE